MSFWKLRSSNFSNSLDASVLTFLNISIIFKKFDVLDKKKELIKPQIVDSINDISGFFMI